MGKDIEDLNSSLKGAPEEFESGESIEEIIHTPRADRNSDVAGELHNDKQEREHYNKLIDLWG